MVQGVPDDNQKQSDSAEAQLPNIEAIEEVTQAVNPVILDNTDFKSASNENPVILDASDSKSPAEDVPASIQPIPKAPPPKPMAGTLYLLSYLLWEREGAATFELTRAQLLDTITLLIEHLRTNADGLEQVKHIILGGQTVLIEDIARRALRFSRFASHL